MITQGVFIADRYEVIDKVGSGGMSDVYRAKDHILGREVAIKILKQEFSEDATFVAKFRTEAQSAAGLEHPNIVNIYDVGSENGMYFIVMEYVEGITLKTYIEKKGQLNFKEAISIAIQVGRGIEAAHQKGIIHRDIKPQNIIISTEGKVKVTDFGIARAASANTIHADVMGSVHYSSPEQARNGFVDGKSDIYSLGIVMYEMVTGRVPFDGDNTVAIAIQHLQEDMVVPSAYAPDLPISLEKIILKATMKSPDRRYGTISDLLMDLKRALVSPDEDFVSFVENDLGKTQVINRYTPEQEASLTQKAADALRFDDDDDYNEEDEYYDDEDDEYYDDDDDYYDDDDEDEGDDSKMDRILTISGIVAAIAIVAIVVAIAGNFIGIFDFGSKKVKMVNLVGTQYEEALQKLEDLGLNEKNVLVSYEENGEAANTVTAQSVKEGEEFSLKDTLRITVAGAGPNSGSSGGSDSGNGSGGGNSGGDANNNQPTEDPESADGQISVPSVVNLSQAEATRLLDDKGIVVTETTKEFSDEVPEGSVISQSIEAGEMVEPNAKITLVVSKGKKENTYNYHVDNPFDKDCIYTIAELNRSDKIPAGGGINISNVSRPELTITLTPVITSSAGDIVPLEDQKVTKTIQGTVAE
ncbi:MAG: Stk1 family PASTA domain-containing Ser/Thr kinase [Pseudobutyrivibrio sp.]|nr:Stk1 family PASTA domain-containing Ser/Thr kinase [Pseudobutyrivibrio sp.]